MSVPSLRQELRDYVGTCERLLASSLRADGQPFTDQEAQIIKYYGEELAYQALVALELRAPVRRSSRQWHRQRYRSNRV